MTHSFYSDTGERSAAYALLRLAVDRVYGIAMPEIEKTAEGKPFFPQRPDIFFSISHSKNHVFAVVSSAPCGCDIEEIRPFRQETALRVASREDLARFSFLDLWTLKESYMKLKGNFKKQIREICFDLKDGKIIPPETALYACLPGISGVHSAIICEEEISLPPIFIPSSQLLS